MFPPRWFLPYDVTFQLLTAVVALAVGLFAYHGYRRIHDRTLGAIFLAFVLLAMGFFVKGLVLALTWAYGVNYAEHGTLVDVLNLGVWAYYALSIVAFGILIYAYSRQLTGPSMAMAAAASPSLLLISPIFELAIVVLLLIILIAQLMHLMVKRTQNAELVVMSFSLLLFSHVLFMLSDANGWLFIIASVLQLAAFSLLLLILYRLRGPS